MAAKRKAAGGKSAAAGKKTIKVTLLRSVINTPSDHRATVRGMINKVIYLVSFEG